MMSIPEDRYLHVVFIRFGVWLVWENEGVRTI